MDVRRVEALINGLPTDSAYSRDANPTTVGSNWGHVEELLATVAQLIDLGNRQFAMANSKRGSRMPEGIKIRRPWERTIKRQATAAEVQALLGLDVPVVRLARGE